MLGICESLSNSQSRDLHPIDYVLIGMTSTHLLISPHSYKGGIRAALSVLLSCIHTMLFFFIYGPKHVFLQMLSWIFLGFNSLIQKYEWFESISQNVLRWHAYSFPVFHANDQVFINHAYGHNLFHLITALHYRSRIMDSVNWPLSTRICNVLSTPNNRQNLWLVFGLFPFQRQRTQIAFTIY